MWLSDRSFRAALLAITLAAPLGLSACSSFTPVYGDNGMINQRVDLAYAAPTSRLEQIIYQDLALHLGKTTDPTAPTVAISVSTRVKDFGDATTPVRQREVTVTAAITLTSAAPDNKVLLSKSRSATADYTVGSQQLANQQALTDAQERAAKSLADTVRLTLIAALAEQVPAQ